MKNFLSLFCLGWLLASRAATFAAESETQVPPVPPPISAAPVKPALAPTNLLPPVSRPAGAITNGNAVSRRQLRGGGTNLGRAFPTVRPSLPNIPAEPGTPTNLPPYSNLGPAIATKPVGAASNVLVGATNRAAAGLVATSPVAMTNLASATNVAVRSLPTRGGTNAPARAATIPAPPVPSFPGTGTARAAGQAVPAGPPAPGALPAIPAVARALGATNAIPGGTNLLATASGDTIIPAGMIALQATPLEQVFVTYAELTGRTILRPNSLPAAAITLKTQTDLTKTEAIQALDSVLTLNLITMIPVGDKFVTAVPSGQALTEGAQFSEVDTEELPEAGQYITKIVQLKYALPSEVQQLIQGFGKVPNGMLAIDSTMTLVLRDYAANIKRMMEIIEKVDVVVDTDYKLEVIPIKYGKVEDIYSTMSTLIGGGMGGGGVGAGGGALGGLGGRSGTSTRGSRGGSRGSSGYRQSANQQQQLGGRQQQQQGMQAGQPGAQGGFQQRLQQIVNRAAGAGGEVQLLKDAKIVPDERSNSLIVFASKEDMVMITNIVSKVDRLLAQVLIEAIIMDVKITDNSEFGVSAIMNPRKNGKLTSVAGMNNGQGFLSGVTNIGSGLPSGFSYFGKYGGDMDVAVKALASSGKGQVLQTPRVQTSHAIAASFFTGETVPYVSGSYYGGAGYGSSTSFQQMEVGIGLNVTPYITPDGLVVMDIQQTIEEISGYTEIANVGKVPNTSRREAMATVSVQDRDTIILGGYIRTAKSKSNSGVPVLKDIPLLGALFSSKSSDNSRSELIVLLRPTVLHTPRDAAIMARSEEDRLPGVREMGKEMERDEKVRHDKADKATGKKRGAQPKPISE